MYLEDASMFINKNRTYYLYQNINWFLNRTSDDPIQSVYISGQILNLIGSLLLMANQRESDAMSCLGSIFRGGLHYTSEFDFLLNEEDNLYIASYWYEKAAKSGLGSWMTFDAITCIGKTIYSKILKIKEKELYEEGFPYDIGCGVTKFTSEAMKRTNQYLERNPSYLIDNDFFDNKQLRKVMTLWAAIEKQMVREKTFDLETAKKAIHIYGFLSVFADKEDKECQRLLSIIHEKGLLYFSKDYYLINKVQEIEIASYWKTKSEL